jgi:alpha-tubulin suppressor-like RCC1 family protein
MSRYSSRLAPCLLLVLAGCVDSTGPGIPAGLVALAVGGMHVCGLDATGAAYCWGDNEYGELGNGDANVVAASQPEPVLGGLHFSTIAAGFADACAVSARTVYCWGASGNMGTHSPVPVPLPVPAARVSSGVNHTCALGTDGLAYCWGLNDHQQLGADSLIGTAPLMYRISHTLHFAALSAGSRHTCGVVADGTAYCWGDNSFGQLGIDSAGPTVTFAVPSPVVGGHTFRQVSAGTANTCGVTTAGAAYCWGENFDGALGIGQEFADVIWEKTPQAVAGDHLFLAIAVGHAHACGLATDHTAWCWGFGYYLGTGDTTHSTVPVAVSGGHQFVRLSTGTRGTCGITTDGATLCWGLVPTAVPNP